MFEAAIPLGVRAAGGALTLILGGGGCCVARVARRPIEAVVAACASVAIGALAADAQGARARAATQGAATAVGVVATLDAELRAGGGGALADAVDARPEGTRAAAQGSATAIRVAAAFFADLAAGHGRALAGAAHTGAVLAGAATQPAHGVGTALPTGAILVRRAARPGRVALAVGVALLQAGAASAVGLAAAAVGPGATLFAELRTGRRRANASARDTGAVGTGSAVFAAHRIGPAGETGAVLVRRAVGSRGEALAVRVALLRIRTDPAVYGGSTVVGIAATLLAQLRAGHRGAGARAHEADAVLTRPAALTTNRVGTAIEIGAIAIGWAIGAGLVALAVRVARPTGAAVSAVEVGPAAVIVDATLLAQQHARSRLAHTLPGAVALMRGRAATIGAAVKAVLVCATRTIATGQRRELALTARSAGRRRLAVAAAAVAAVIAADALGAVGRAAGADTTVPLAFFIAVALFVELPDLTILGATLDIGTIAPELIDYADSRRCLSTTGGNDEQAGKDRMATHVSPPAA